MQTVERTTKNPSKPRGALASLPRQARILVSLTVMGGAAALALRVPGASRWAARDLVAFVLVAVATAAAEQFPLALRFGPETHNFTLTDAVWAAGLVLVHSTVLTLAVVAGIVAGQLIRRWAAHKVAFNAGQFCLGITAAELVYGAFGRPVIGSHLVWAAVPVAMAAFYVVNVVLLDSVIAAVTRQRFAQVARACLPVNVANLAGNAVIGLFAAMVWTSDRAAMAAVVVPLVLAYAAYGSWVERLQPRGSVPSPAESLG